MIAVGGELDLGCSARLEAELRRVESEQLGLVVVDLRELRFMDSTGLKVLIDAHRRAQQAGRRFALVNGQQQVRRLLSLTGVDQSIVGGLTPEELLDQR